MKKSLKSIGSAVLALSLWVALSPRAVAWDSWDGAQELQSVQATRIPLVSVTAETEPGLTGKIGITTAADGSIASFYFQAPSGKTLEYSPSELKSGSRVLVSKSGYDVVKVKALAASDRSLKLNIIYLKSVVSKSTGNRILTIQYSASMNQYQIIDENGRPVRSAHVSTQRNLIGVAVGVAAISTQQ
jgi:hypothetical protein